MAHRVQGGTTARTESLPAPFKRYRPDILAALRGALSRDGLPVYGMLRYAMGWADVDGNPVDAVGGKALRPTLCLLACEAVGGRPVAALPAAVSLELIHNFSLIHDDIQDRDETRHHRPTLWKVWGDPKALIAGSTLNVLADMALWDLVREGVAVQRALEVGRLLARSYLTMIEGQYLDISFEGRLDVGMNDYLDMVSKKTGALIQCAMHLGALIGTEDVAAVQAIRECGRSLGYVFQIRDDVLGIWGDEENTGKPVGADIRRRKNTLPVVYAMSQARGPERDLLEEVYHSALVDDTQVASVLAVLDRLGSREFADDLVAQHSHRALESLRTAELSPRAFNDVEEMTSFLRFRQH